MRLTLRLESLAVATCFLIVAPSPAEPLSKETKNLLEQIIRANEANRAKINTFLFEGSTERRSDNEGKTSIANAQFTLYTSGNKQRLDWNPRPESSPSPTQGDRTRIVVFDGQRTLSHRVNDNWASIEPPAYYNTYNELRWLDVLAPSPAWTTNMEHIHHLLTRGWNDEKESISAQSVAEGGRALIAIHYESMRGGSLTRYDWTVDPQRGYEVTRAEWLYKGSNNSGTAVYDTQEVHPGIWRAVGVDFNAVNKREDGSTIAQESIRILPKRIEANTKSLDESVFTLRSMGVPLFAYIQDDTFSPPLRYRFGAAGLSEEELDNALSNAMTPTTQASNAPEESTTSNTRTAGARAPQQRGEDGPRSNHVVWLFLVVLTLLGAFAGYRLSRGRPRRPDGGKDGR